MSTPLEKIALSVRAYNCAKRFGINTVEELEERIEEFCDHAPNFGKEAREVLRMREINLRTIGKKEETTVPETQILSAEYTKAVALHRRICANAQAAQESLWEVCRGMKEMHNDRLFKELGYASFKEYCEKELDITDRQARNYITLADSFTEEERKSISSFGATKLLLLAKLDEPQRQEIQQAVNVEEVSVRELKAKISELEKNKSRLIDDLKSACDERDKERGYREELADENGKMSDRISELIAQVDELEARPVEVIAKPDEELIKQHLKEIDDMQRGHKEEMDELRSRYEKQMKKGIEEAKKNAQAPDISELWGALNDNLDYAIEAIEDFFDDYEDHPKIKDCAKRLKGTIRDLNTTVNNVLAGEDP